MNSKQVVTALTREAAPLMIIIPAAIVAHLLFHLLSSKKAN